MEGKGPKVPGCKVVLLGDSGVGKTCIISRYISGSFEKNLSSTNGASYCSKMVKFETLGKNLLLDIWDTAGQEKYKSLTKFFYKDASIVILVYDITRKESFDNLTEYWYNQLQENCAKNIVLGIAGNKCDLYEDEKVKESDVREFAEKVGAIFELTSAQNNTGINDLFEKVGNKYLDPNFQDKKKQGDEEKEKDGNQNIVLDNKQNEKKENRRRFC